jgi:hypothetical protein
MLDKNNIFLKIYPKIPLNPPPHRKWGFSPAQTNLTQIPANHHLKKAT